MIALAAVLIAAGLYLSIFQVADSKQTRSKPIPLAAVATTEPHAASTRNETLPIPVMPAPVATASTTGAEKPAQRLRKLPLPLPASATKGQEKITSKTLQLPELPADKKRPAIDSAIVDNADDRLELLIKSGDSLDRLFAANKLSRGDLARLVKLDQASPHLQMLRPGDKLSVVHRDGRILELDRVLDAERTLHIRRDNETFVTEISLNPVERRSAHAHGTIDSSLFRAAQRAGVSDTLIMNLAGIFAWDIDFVLDIRQGDTFTVLYEEIWQDGEKLRDGEILAAEFSNGGDIFRAIRFDDPDTGIGYFTPDGHNVKKAFLRAPISITPRVTSNFNPRRLHPVHKKVRPHRGVDYGAPSGTPIKAAGDGKVIFRGRKGSYGNAVILQHGGNITTLYAHMSKFHKRARNGARIKQGQTIGYVGATGTVTAAHLHYEYRVGGVHRNPRTVKLPQAQPVASKHRQLFADVATPLIQRLDLVQRTLVLAKTNTD